MTDVFSQHYFSKEIDRYIQQGSVYVVQMLLKRWSEWQPEKFRDGAASYLERLREMEAIEAEHGVNSLDVVGTRARRIIEALPPKSTARRQLERSDALRIQMGEDWWAWAHRPHRLHHQAETV